MRQFLLRVFWQKSLQTQLMILAVGAVGLTAAAALGATWWSQWDGGSGQVLRLRLIAALGLSTLICLAALHTLLGRLLRPLYRIRDAMWQVSQGQLAPLPQPPAYDVMGLNHTLSSMVDRLRHTAHEHERAKHALAHRTRTVDQLLEFSQNIQGAGKPEQVYATLAHHLQMELNLTGLTILSFDPDGVPPATVRAAWPDDLLLAHPPVGEMETALCPCHRQHLPRHFRPDGSPVRCTLDQSLSLPNVPQHAAYCIPFTAGGRSPGVVHMLLPTGQQWSDEAKHLAQTYVNTAQSALISLHLLGEAEKQSMTDPLTGLYNRRSLETLMQREVALAERHHQPLTLVMIDMDRFKPINDTFGHAAGDHLLRSFADCVRITLRKTDLAFRFGGDEFAIGLPQTTAAQAEQVVQKLRQAFAAVDFSGAIAKLERQPTLSIGVAERSPATNVLTLANLLSAADQALYEAKSANRNCIKVYQPKAA